MGSERATSAAKLGPVSTPLGAEGFPVSDSEQLVLADSPADFAVAVVALLEDRSRREALGNAARRFARGYDWRQIVPAFEEVYRTLAAG